MSSIQMTFKKIIAVGLAGIIALSSCATLTNKEISKQSTANSLESRVKTEVPPIHAVPFAEFYPEPSDFQNIDPLYRKFIEGELNIDMLKQGNNFASSLLNMIKKPFSSPLYNPVFKIPSKVNFNEERNILEVFSIAQNLGYSLEDIKRINVHDAIFLSGLITSEKMNPMIVDENDSERQKKLYSLYERSVDETFSFGLGVCGQYAEINMAVFNLLKTQNPKLKNVIMKYATSFGKHYIKEHAWNEILAPSGDGSFLLTAVDSTALEHITMDKNPELTKDKIRGMDLETRLKLKKETYNVLSSGKYYIGKYYLYDDLAILYEALASKTRPLFIDGKYFAFSKDARKQYLEIAFANRLQSCEAIFEILNYASQTENQTDTYERFKKQFSINFNLLMKDTTDKRTDELARIKQLYDRSNMLLDKRTKRVYLTSFLY